MARPPAAAPRRLLGQQRHLGEAALGDGAHHLHDPAVGEVLVAAHEDAPVRVVLRDRLQLGDQVGQVDLWSCRKIVALRVDRDGQRLLSLLSGCALVFGRSTDTPEVISGAVTMKMISSTSITSTSGVTLISASGR